MAPVKAAPSKAPVVDVTKPVAVIPAAPLDVQRFRVLRPVLHGPITLYPGVLVDMSRAEAQHLVETNALAPHIVPQEVTSVVDLASGVATVDGVKAAITGAEVAGAIDAPGPVSPAATAPVAELDTRGDVRLT